MGRPQLRAGREICLCAGANGCPGVGRPAKLGRMDRTATSLPPDALAGTELFLGLPPPPLADVLGCARVRRLAKGAIVFAQGDVADRCHAVIEGRIRIAQSDQDGAQLLVRFVGPGEMFGTVALFTDRQYPAEASAVTDCVEM